MDIKLLATVFGTIFLAELGDKTQLATLLFAAREGSSLMTIFVAASSALIVTTAINVLAGAVIANICGAQIPVIHGRCRIHIRWCMDYLAGVTIVSSQ